jgi:iron(III) transport system substrate-binding protein
MRRYLYILLFFFVLAAPFVLRLVIARPSTISRAGSSHDVPRLIILTPHNQDIRQEFAAAFSRWHQGNYGRPVAMDYRTIGGTNDIRRQLESMYRPYRNPEGTLKPEANVPIDADVVWGGGDYFFNTELKRDLGILRPLSLPKSLLDEVFPQPALGGVRLYDGDRDAAGNPAPRWVGVCLSSFGICYNADLYDRLGMTYPRTWTDLTGERLAGMLALADPTHSGSVAVAYNMVIQRRMADAEEAYRQTTRGPGGQPLPREKLDRKDPAYQAALDDGWHRGMGDLQLIAANSRYFTDSSTQVPNDVGNGQAAAGVVIDFYGRSFEEFVGPRRCKFVSPVAATAITPDPVAILYGVSGDRLTVATHFVEFLLSVPGQELWIKRPGTPNGPQSRALRRPPIRAGLYAPGADRSDWTDDVNPFAESGGFNQRNEWLAYVTDTRGLWAAAWLDAGDEMKEAYAKIIAVKDARRRAGLLARFADVPAHLKDLRDQAAERDAVRKSGGDLDAWNARTRMKWSARFRDHYRELAGAAARSG